MSRKLAWLVAAVALVALGLMGNAAPAIDGSVVYPSSEVDCWYETDTVYGPWLFECTCYRCNWTHRCWGNGCYSVNFERRTITLLRRLCCYYEGVGTICDDWEVTGQGTVCRQISHSFLGGCGCSSPGECGNPVCDCCVEIDP